MNLTEAYYAYGEPEKALEYQQSYLDSLGFSEKKREKMAELPPEDFEGVLHPAFEEDEIQLILLGGALGALAGALQLLMFSNEVEE